MPDSNYSLFKGGNPHTETDAPRPLIACSKYKVSETCLLFQFKGLKSLCFFLFFSTTYKLTVDIIPVCVCVCMCVHKCMCVCVCMQACVWKCVCCVHLFYKGGLITILRYTVGYGCCSCDSLLGYCRCRNLVPICCELSAIKHSLFSGLELVRI